VQPVRCFEAALAAASPSLSLSSANAAPKLGFAVPRPKASLGAVPDLLLMPPRERPKPLPPIVAKIRTVTAHCLAAVRTQWDSTMTVVQHHVATKALQRLITATTARNRSRPSGEQQDMQCKLLTGVSIIKPVVHSAGEEGGHPRAWQASFWSGASPQCCHMQVALQHTFRGTSSVSVHRWSQVSGAPPFASAATANTFAAAALTAW
jgi:hypothetical protein